MWLVKGDWIYNDLVENGMVVSLGKKMCTSLAIVYTNRPYPKCRGKSKDRRSITCPLPKSYGCSLRHLWSEIIAMKLSYNNQSFNQYNTFF